MKFTTGVKSIDSLLSGGIETGVITHVYGAFGTGKSILAQQICVTVLKDSRKNDSVIYMDTEGSFNPKRISKIAFRFGLDYGVLKRILYKRIWSLDEQELFLKLSEDYIYRFNAKLLVIDCIATHIRGEFNQDVLILRQTRLESILNKLLDMCTNYDVAALVTNQLTSGPDSSGEKYVEKPVGGNLIAKFCKCSIRLYRLKEKRYASLDDSIDVDSNFAPFVIKEDGIHDENG